jgi:hypothetical protein
VVNAIVGGEVTESFSKDKKTTNENERKTELPKAASGRSSDMANAAPIPEHTRPITVKKTNENEVKVNEPTYTRMARRHLSIETLRVHNLDFEYDNVSCRPSGTFTCLDTYTSIDASPRLTGTI